jgi:hypothetical protein
MFATYKLLRECVQFILITQVWAGRRSQFDTVITRLFMKCSNSFINYRNTVASQRERLRKMPMLNTKTLHGVIMAIFNCAKNGIVVHRRRILFGRWFDLRNNNNNYFSFLYSTGLKVLIVYFLCSMTRKCTICFRRRGRNFVRKIECFQY